MPVKAEVQNATSITSTPGNLTFENLPAKVRAHHPQLTASRKLIAEAQGRLRQSGLRSNPSVEIEFEADRRFHDLIVTVGYSQKFPRTNRLLLEKRASAILVRAAEAEVRDVERQLIGQARLAFTKVLALRQEQILIKAQEQNARQLAEFITSSVEKAEASPLEAGTALLAATRLANRAEQTSIRAQLALAQLKSLLGLTVDTPLTLPASLPETELPPLMVSSIRRPDLQAAQLRAQSATAATDLEKARRTEDIEAGIFAGVGREEDAPHGLESEQIIGFRIKIPLSTHNDNSGNIAAAQARESRLAAQARALSFNIGSEARAYHQEMQQWKALTAQISTKLLPLADAQISKAREAYDRGEIPLQDVLRAQEQRLSLRLAELEAARDFHLARARYLTATAQ